MMTLDINKLKEARLNVDAMLDNMEDHTQNDIKEAANALCSEVEEWEDELEEVREAKLGRERAMEHLETRYSRLFSGDLSKLDHGERWDLFRAIAEIEFSDSHNTDAERTLERINGKL